MLSNDGDLACSISCWLEAEAQLVCCLGLFLSQDIQYVENKAKPFWGWNPKKRSSKYMTTAKRMLKGVAHKNHIAEYVE